MAFNFDFGLDAEHPSPSFVHVSRVYLFEHKTRSFMSIFDWVFGSSKATIKVKEGSDSPSPKPDEKRTHALPYHQIHGENKYDSSLKQTEMTRAYTVAEKKLREKPYAERKFKTKENIIKVRSFYPYLSVFLSLSVGIMTGDLFASGLSQEAYYLTLGLLTVAVFLVAWLLEDLKRDACRDYFLSEEPNPKQRFWLNSLFLYSLIISGIGGYVASIHLNDRSAEIEAVYQNQSDSVNVNYGEQLNVLNAIISENKSRMQSGSKWVRYHAQKDLAQAQKQKMELLAQQSNQLSDLKTEKKEVLHSESVLNQYKAYIIVLVVFLLETLYIRSFAYEYAVERNIKAENQNHGIVPPPTEMLPTSQPLTIQDIAMQMLLNQLTGGGQMMPQSSGNAVKGTPYASPSYKPYFTSQAGFKFGQEDSPQTETPKPKTPERTDNQKSQEEKPLVRKCANCQKEFVHKHWKAKYCSDACRVEAWEKRNGRPLKRR